MRTLIRPQLSSSPIALLLLRQTRTRPRDRLADELRQEPDVFGRTPAQSSYDEIVAGLARNVSVARRWRSRRSSRRTDRRGDAGVGASEGGASTRPVAALEEGDSWQAVLAGGAVARGRRRST